ncbi:MAG TPA: AAA family ATPase [Propionibacteriaceae bacterium]
MITLPTASLVLLVGPSGVGKTTFARRWFDAGAVVSSDDFRKLVADDETDQDATADAFEVLHLVTAKRVGRRLTTVVDATNLKPEDRARSLDLAGEHGVAASAIVFDLPLDTCLSQNQGRLRRVPEEVVREHHLLVQAAVIDLAHEDFASVFRLTSHAEVDEAVVRWAAD